MLLVMRIIFGTTRRSGTKIISKRRRSFDGRTISLTVKRVLLVPRSGIWKIQNVVGKSIELVMPDTQRQENVPLENVEQ
jgi:hypothetical protein